MKNVIVILGCILVLLGCDRTVKFNPSLNSLPEYKASVVFYLESGKGLLNPSVAIPIIANDVEIGTLDTGEWLTKSLEPGTYKLHSQTAAIDRVSNFTFEKGKVYFVKVWVDIGMWASSVRFTQTKKPEKI